MPLHWSPSAGADDAVAFGAQAGDEQVAEGFDALGDVLDADGLEQVQRCFEGQQAGDVVAAAFEAGGVGAKGVIVVSEILGVDDVHPADHQGAGVVDQLAAAEEDAGAFGAEEPFVAVGGEEVDVHGADIDRKNTEGLDGVDAEEDFPFGAELADAGEIMALAAGEFDVGERHQAGAGFGGGLEDFFEGDVAACRRGRRFLRP